MRWKGDDEGGGGDRWVHKYHRKKQKKNLLN